MMRAGIDYVTKGGRGLRPIFLPATLYDAAKAKGVDMTPYVRQEPIPAVPGR